MGGQPLQASPVQRYLEQLYEELLEITGGEVASYIPELTRADPSWLGIAIVTVDGHVYQAGDSRQRFTIQSISKAITYGLALEDRGLDYVMAKVGVEPSGEAFNSISLEPAIGHLLYGHGIVDRTPEEVLDLYFRQCSILVTARDLAIMGACLANNGVNPVTGVVALQSRYVEKVLSVMSTCGMYDYSGGWIFNVGMPAKSGVGGGIMAVLPGQFGLGVFSPPLDEKGNSVRGIEACKRLSSDFKLHLFHVARSTSASIIRQVYDCSKFASRRRRNAAEVEVLSIQGHRIRVYELQGELLFGSAESVTFDMLSALSDVDYLVVDLKRVVAMDNASILVLSDLCGRTAQEGKRLYFTHCRHLYRFRKHLQKDSGKVQAPDWLHFEDTDHAVEWCEDQLIAGANVVMEPDAPAADLAQQYLCSGMTSEELEALRRAGQERQFAAGTRVFQTGDAAHCLYFIFAGEVEVLIDTDSGHELRMKTLGPGMVFGEVALLNQKRRTANVSAEHDDLRCADRLRSKSGGRAPSGVAACAVLSHQPLDLSPTGTGSPIW